MLIDMIIADFTSEEACIYSQLCMIPTDVKPGASISMYIFDFYAVCVYIFAFFKILHLFIVTNEIYDNNDEESVRPMKEANQCILCEFIMTKLKKILKDKKTEVLSIIFVFLLGF